MNIRCPFAQWTHSDGYDSHPSFGISLHDDAPSAYKCFSCNMTGRLASLPTRLGGYRKKDYSKLRSWAEAAEMDGIASKPLPDWEAVATIDYNAATAGETVLPETALNLFPQALGLPYLSQRNVTFLDVMRMQLRFDPIQQRVLFPVYDYRQRFRGFTGRSILPESTYSKANPKVRDYFGLNKLELFLHLRNRHKEQRKIIVEGLFDYANLVHNNYLGTHAVLGTASTPEKIRILIDSGEPVYLLFDNDVAGWQAAFGIPDKDGSLNTSRAWAFQLYNELSVWIVPYERSFDGSDPGSLPSEVLHRMINNAWLFNGRAPFNSNGDRIATKPKWARTL
jgi:hypothetical protein